MQEIQFIKGTFVVMAYMAPRSSSAQGSRCTVKAQFPKTNIPVLQMCVVGMRMGIQE